jgi:hypothetical protein
MSSTAAAEGTHGEGPLVGRGMSVGHGTVTADRLWEALHQARAGRRNVRS